MRLAVATLALLFYALTACGGAVEAKNLCSQHFSPGDDDHGVSPGDDDPGIAATDRVGTLCRE